MDSTTADVPQVCTPDHSPLHCISGLIQYVWDHPAQKQGSNLNCLCRGDCCVAQRSDTGSVQAGLDGAWTRCDLWSSLPAPQLWDPMNQALQARHSEGGLSPQSSPWGKQLRTVTSYPAQELLFTSRM